VPCGSSDEKILKLPLMSCSMWWLQGRCALASISGLRSRSAVDAHKVLEARATSAAAVLTIEPTVHRSFP